MSIKPTRYRVDNGQGISVDVEIDSESISDGPLYFEIQQDGESIVITEQTANDILMAIGMLVRSRQE